MTISAADGAAALILCHCQESEIALCRASGSDPCDTLVDVAAGCLRSEEVRGIVRFRDRCGSGVTGRRQHPRHRDGCDRQVVHRGRW